MFRIYLFGLPHVEQDGISIQIARRKSLAVLAYLAVTAKPQSRDVLAALCYPDSDQSSARNNLRRDLFELKTNRGEQILHTERDLVSLNPTAELWVDVTEFQAYLEKARQHHPGLHGDEQNPVCADCQAGLTKAVDLYAADFMAGFSLPGSREFEDWQFFQADALRKALAETLAILIRWHSDRNQFDLAILYARRWLALDPYHEPAQRELMRLYAISGQQSAALRQYQECVRLLHEQLGLEPENETNALYDAIRTRQLSRLSKDGTTPLVPAPTPGLVRNNLPLIMDSPFVGRDDELARIVNSLRDDPDCRLLTLTGPGGIGKTNLAIEAASRLADDPGCPFCEGIIFVSLAAVSQADSIILAVADALRLPLLPDPEGRTRQLLDYLQPKRLLLVLDNFEHLISVHSVRLLVDLLTHAHQVKLLVTSRTRLNAHFERILHLTSLDVPRLEAEFQGQPVERTIAGYSAVQLFALRARSARPDFSITPGNIAAVIQICQMVDGMPLGIELAAAWLEVLMPVEIVAEITHSLDFLAANWPDRPERHHSLRAVFDSSWRLLAETERVALLPLTLFQSSFSRQAAQAVSGASIHVLLALQNKSWLQYNNDGRFQIHELLCQYANEKLRTDPGAWALARDRFCSYYTGFLADQAEKFKGPGQKEAIEAITLEFENARLAWRWLVEAGQVETVVNSMLFAFYRHAEARARPLELQQLLDLALEALASQGDSAIKSRLQAILSTARISFTASGFSERYISYPFDLNFRSSDHNLYLQNIWSLARDIETLQTMGFWGILLCSVAQYVIERSQTILCLRELLPYFRAQDCRWELANILYLLGRMFERPWYGIDQTTLGTDEAERCLLEALGIFQYLGDKSSCAYVLHSLGAMDIIQENYAVGITRYRMAQANLREAGEWWQAAFQLARIGQVYFDLSDFKLGFEYYHLSVQAAEDIGDRERLAGLLSEESILALRYSDLEHARRTRLQSLAFYQEVGNERNEAWAAWELGEIERVGGDLASAREWFDKARRLFENTGDRTSPIFIQRGLGDLAQMSGDYWAAKEYFRESLQVAQETNHEWAQIYALCGIGRAEVALRETEAAWEHFSQALRIATRQKQDTRLIALAGFASLCASIGETEQAVELASLVIKHKLSWNETKAQMVTLLHSINELPPEQLKAAEESGRNLELDDAVRRLIPVERENEG